MEKLVNFNKIMDDLENIEVKFDDEDKVLLLLNALIKIFEHFNDFFIWEGINHYSKNLHSN